MERPQKASSHRSRKPYIPRLSKRFETEGWDLENAEKRHAHYPETFAIPDRAERDSLVVGQMVQLLFWLKREMEGQTVIQCEKMWVTINEVAGGKYRGVLESDPFSSQVIRSGQVIEFGPEHVSCVFIRKTDPRHPDYKQPVPNPKKRSRKRE
jgi:hypothetical protein